MYQGNGMLSPVQAHPLLKSRGIKSERTVASHSGPGFQYRLNCVSGDVPAGGAHRPVSTDTASHSTTPGFLCVLVLAVGSVMSPTEIS